MVAQWSLPAGHAVIDCYLGASLKVSEDRCSVLLYHVERHLLPLSIDRQDPLGGVCRNHLAGNHVECRGHSGKGESDHHGDKGYYHFSPHGKITSFHLELEPKTPRQTRETHRSL